VRRLETILGRHRSLRKALSEKGPVVVWIRLPNTRRRDLLTWFETALPDVLAAVERGERSRCRLAVIANFGVSS